jgi:hypothetical protein
VFVAFGLAALSYFALSQRRQEEPAPAPALAEAE